MDDHPHERGSRFFAEEHQRADLEADRAAERRALRDIALLIGGSLLAIGIAAKIAAALGVLG